VKDFHAYIMQIFRKKDYWHTEISFR